VLIYNEPIFVHQKAYEIYATLSITKIHQTCSFFIYDKQYWSNGF